MTETRTYISGTFILPPKPEHEALLAELEAASKHARLIRGHVVYPHQAKAVLTLHDTLHDQSLREALLNKPLSVMISTTLRVQDLSTDSWYFSRQA